MRIHGNLGASNGGMMVEPARKSHDIGVDARAFQQLLDMPRCSLGDLRPLK